MSAFEREGRFDAGLAFICSAPPNSVRRCLLLALSGLSWTYLGGLNPPSRPKLATQNRHSRDFRLGTAYYLKSYFVGHL